MLEKKRVIQLLPALSYGDGVGNDTLAIDRLLKREGYDTHIYAEYIDERIDKEIASCISQMPEVREEDYIIYHLASGSKVNDLLKTFKGKKMIVYHNVTPPEFFAPYNQQSELNCKAGQRAVRDLSDVADYCLAVSDYNKQDLLNCGYRSEMAVVPILIPFSDYEKKPAKSVLRKYKKSGYTNVLFTGRIVPNKTQEDVIYAFYHYQKYYNPKSRLFLVGSYNGMEIYYNRLQEFVARLGVQNVIFTGHIKFDEILAYYKLADLFLCMSEHEGFCIPLIEAMFFDVPIIAYQSSGVVGTMDGCGIPIYERNPLEIAGVMNYVQTHPELRKTILENQRTRLQRFDNQKVEKEFLSHLDRFVNQN